MGIHQLILGGSVAAGGMITIITDADNGSSSPYGVPWEKGVGFGTVYSSATGAHGASRDTSALSDSSAMFSERGGFPLSTSGWGTRFTGATSDHTQGYDGEVGPNDDYMVTTNAYDTAERTDVWAVSSSGWGSQVSYPASAPSFTAGRGCAFGNTNGYLMFTGTGTPYAATYPWTGSAFGTKHSDPSSTASDTSQSCSFNNNDTEVIAGSDSTPLVHAWAFSASGMGTARSAPSSTPTSSPMQSCDFNDDGTECAFGEDASPRVAAYPYSSGFGTKRSAPASPPANTGNWLRFSDDGELV